MATSFFARLVGVSCRNAVFAVLISVALAIAAGVYVSGHFAMDSDAENLFSPDLPWRQRQTEFDAAFPQRNQLTLVVIDGVTPERATQAGVGIRNALNRRKDLFPIVRDIQGSDFFAHNGLLFLPLDDVRSATQHLIDAQPLLASLATDPSLRGIMDSLSTALLGVEKGQTKLDDLARPLSAFASTLEDAVAGRSAFLSWQNLITGERPGTRQSRRLIEVQAALDFAVLSPGARSSATIRKIAADNGFTPEHGVTVRLTGPVPLTDEEFATLAERAALLTALMVLAILVTLWLAVRSAKIMLAILVTLFAGLTITMALGLAAIGSLNVISVAFIPLFVGIGVDFGIQYSVRYRAERHTFRDLDEALRRAGAAMGPSLTLAAVATAACFFSFVPTSYSGLAELGFIAGAGMLIAFVLNGAMLPAALKLLHPQGEQREVGYAWLAPVDRFLRERHRAILVSAGILCLAGLSLLPFLEFDANPYDLRSTRVESMATLLDLMKDPETSPNTIDILAPSLEAAEAMADTLAHLPEVDQVMTAKSFVPERQPEKLALIEDASLLLDTTLNPLGVKPQPTAEQTSASIAATARELRKAAGSGASATVNEAARRLADVLDRLLPSGGAVLARTEAALVPGLETVLTQLRALLAPEPVSLDTLPQDLKSEWLAPDGKARVQVFAKGNSNDNQTLAKFSAAVRALAPNATGAPISTRESGRTIVSAFIEAGILSFLAMVVLLAIALRKPKDVLLAVVPLGVASILTFGTCVAIGLPLNFANIIVLPLLFGIGVAFNIYFVMSWRAGGGDFLQSSLARAVILSAATTGTGFGVLWLSSHPGTASMGELLTISLGWTLLTTLLFLPALLEFSRAKS
jgi:uncharacterized protein